MSTSVFFGKACCFSFQKMFENPRVNVRIMPSISNSVSDSDKTKTGFPFYFFCQNFSPNVRKSFARKQKNMH